MKLFVFAAIIFTMVSTTSTCEDVTSVCHVTVGSQNSSVCNCAGSSSCPKDADYAFPADQSGQDATLYACQKKADFSDCTNGQDVLTDMKINCKCTSGKIKLSADPEVCG
uniref:Conotoxin n=1 Tax=Conus andremenezi TaxID=1077466 RepID=A0A291C258_9COND|nr:conotoxin [Conus andremenezi]